MTQDEKYQIIQDCLKMFRETFPGVTVPKIEWNGRMRTTAGRVKYRHYVPYLIQLNPNLLTERHRLERTFYHELAHVAALTLYKSHGTGHGKAWKSCMKKLGRTTERCHSYDTTGIRRRATRYEAYCECRTHTITSHRRTKILNGSRYYTCINCRTRLVLSRSELNVDKQKAV